MKLLFLFGLFVAVSYQTISQTKLLQGFEAATYPPAGWILEYTGTLYWERAPVGAYGLTSGSTVFRFYEAPASTVQSLVTPAFTASVAGDSVSFDHAYATFSGEVDSLVIEVSPDNGSTYSRLIALEGGPVVGTGMVTAEPTFAEFTPTSSEWATKRYLLPIGTNKVRFTAKSDFGNNLYLDNIRVGQPSANDVGVAGIGYPRYFVNLPFPLTPKATITNFGSQNQATPFSTTMRITGPSGFLYSSTKSDSLSSGLSRTITFDATFNPVTPGNYLVTCFTNLSGDQSRTNDTVRMTVAVNNFNYGSSGESADQIYYFTNSLSGTGAPSQPQFALKDTSGSTDLIVNGVAVVPMTGDVDDGYFTLTNLFPGKSFRLFGTDFADTVYVSTNGIISFTEGYDAFEPSAIPSGFTPNAAIYALWADFDFSSPAVAVNRLSYKIDGDLLIVSFARAPLFNADADDFVSFQVCMRFSSDTLKNSFVSVQFDSARTGSSFLTAYNNFSFPHLVGMEDQTGTAAITYRFVAGGAPYVPGPLFGSSVAVTLGPAYASSVKINIRALLQGPYSATVHAMQTGLRASIPLTQPYASPPWSFAGAEHVTSPPDSVVDWVLVELRTGTAGSTEAGRRAAFMKYNGSVVDVDRSSPVTFDLMPPGNYYIVCSHRNHFPVMSSATIAANTTGSAYDFTTGMSQAYGVEPMNQVEAGVFASVAGDVNQSGLISPDDLAAVFGGLNLTGYSSSDVNLSTIVSIADINMIFGNLNRSSQVPGASPSREQTRKNPFLAPVHITRAADLKKTTKTRRNEDAHRGSAATKRKKANTDHTEKANDLHR